jgi:hypothetical protein
MKTVYNKSTGTPVIAHEDPKVAGRYALPAGSVDVEPPAFNSETQTCSWDGSQWVVADIPVPEPESTPEPVPAIDQLRNQRNSLLAETDWWVLPDRTPTQAQLDYRQALRDLPATASPALDENGNLTGVTWPNKPE